MKIFTAEIKKAFAKQGDTSQMSTADIKIVMKMFNPTGGGTWYIYEKLGDVDSFEDDTYMAFVNLGDVYDAECGTVSMQELLSFRGRFGLKIERDMYFKPLSMSLHDVMVRIKDGKHV